MINFIKGILVGIFNIIPGLSGSALLMALNLYDKCIFSISNFFKDPKNSFLFLFPIALGIILGTYIFSNIIFFFINNFTIETYTVFTFLILTTIPHLLKEATKEGFKKKYLLAFFITFFIGTLLLFIDFKDSNLLINYNLVSILKYFLIGIILSFSTVIPGISSTATLSIVSLYNIYIYAISSLDFYILIPIVIGFILTTFLISKLINYLIKNYYGYTYFSILGFALSTILFIIKVSNVFNSSFLVLFVTGIVLFFIMWCFVKEIL